MDILPLFAGFLVLALAHVLRPAGRAGQTPSGQKHGQLRAVLGAVFGFALMAGLIAVLSDRHGFARQGPFETYTKSAIERANADPTRPVVVFLGASFTRNALDPDQIQHGLRAKGHDVIVVNLSMEGASYIERGQKLDQWFAGLDGLPDRRVFVFSETSGKFDTAPGFVFRVGKFSDRAIAQFDLEASLWTLNGLAGGNCLGLKECVLVAALLPVHAALNLSQFGLLATGERFAALRATPAFDPQQTPRKTVPDAQAIAEGLLATAESSPQTGPQWALSYRRAERLKLARWPNVRVGYYFPPVVPAEARAHISGLCSGELQAQVCIPADDGALLSALNGPVWLDAEHLLAPGAAIYGEWLIERLDGPMQAFLAGPDVLAGGQP